MRGAALASAFAVGVWSAAAFGAEGPAGASGVEGVVASRGVFVRGAVVLAFVQAGPEPGAAPLAVSAGTDENGRYRLPLKPGSYHFVAVKAAGAAPWPFRGEPEDLYSYYLGNPVSVAAGRMTRVAFNMVKAGERPQSVPGAASGAGSGSGVEGRVVFEDKPLGRAYVQLYKDGSANFHGMGLTAIPADGEGRFRVKVPPGRYYLLARRRQGGGMYGPPGKDDHVGYYPGNPIEVRAGEFLRVTLETTTRVDLLEETLFRDGEGAGWFEGVVAEASGAPVPGQYVLFYTDPGMAGTPAFVAGPTDAKGRFKVRAAAGAFHILARSNLGGPLEAGEWHGKGEIPAGAGKPRGDIRIRVSRYQGQQ